ESSRGVKPLRGKRWGPRSPPGGFNPAARVRPCRRFPADLSRSPFLPTPPPVRAASPPRSPPAPSPFRGVGVGCGRGGVAAGGRRPAAAGRTSTAAVRRDRLRDGWEGPGGEGGPGVPRPVPVRLGGRAGGTGPPGLQPRPGSSDRRIPGRGARTRRRALPPAPPRPPRLAAGRWRGRGGRGNPPEGGPASAPAERRRSERTGSAATSATTRPVLKHGPRSLTRARVRARAKAAVAQ
uniref:Uncharacterized protein LOC109680781 n=1 Tax=Castor canadensis TaxID=51338 RepID=A0A8B7U080_CASCN